MLQLFQYRVFITADKHKLKQNQFQFIMAISCFEIETKICATIP